MIEKIYLFLIMFHSKEFQALKNLEDMSINELIIFYNYFKEKKLIIENSINFNLEFSEKKPLYYNEYND